MTSQLSPTPIFKAFDNNGLPLAFGLLTTYQAGTLTKQATYVDSTQTTQNTNPIQLNFRGECEIWLDPTLTYKFALTDQFGNTIPGWPVDNIPGGFGSAPFSVNFIPNPTNTFTLGSPTNSWAQIYLGANAAPAYDPVSGNIGYYARTAAEISASVTPTNLVYVPADLRRYGAKIDGSTDDTTAINNAIKVAIAGQGYILHPGGTCVHASQILAGNGFSVIGTDRDACIFKYTGSASSSAWRITNNGTSSPVINSSGYGLVNFTGVQITTAVASSTAAAIEINACGYAYYNISACRISGTFKYGLILDGTEVVTVEKNIIENTGPTSAANIWLVNGSDRTPSQTAGFTNSIWIRNNQTNVSGSGSNNIADDGGSNHYIEENNLNGAAVPIRAAGISGFQFSNNECENALGGGATGEANFDFLTTGLGGTAVGGCDSGIVQGNFLGADMGAGSSTLKFGGSASLKHSAITVISNHFRNNGGRSADIDVTNLINSLCDKNYAEPGTSSQHYTGVHNDVYGNDLSPPQAAPPWRALTAYSINAVVFNSPNFYIATAGGTSGNSGGPTGTGTGITDGSVTWNYTTQTTVVGFSQLLRIFGDSRYVNQFVGGVSADSPNGLQIDEQQWQSFTIQITNNAGTLQVAIYDSGVTGNASGYANKVTNGSVNTAVNLPTVSSGSGFGTAAAGLLSGTASTLILNLANSQNSPKANHSVILEQYTGNSATCLVYAGLVSRNINGQTITRVEIRLANALSGAPVNFDTTYLPSGKLVDIKLNGYLG